MILLSQILKIILLIHVHTCDALVSQLTMKHIYICTYRDAFLSIELVGKISYLHHALILLLLYFFRHLIDGLVSYLWTWNLFCPRCPIQWPFM